MNKKFDFLRLRYIQKQKSLLHEQQAYMDTQKHKLIVQKTTCATTKSLYLCLYTCLLFDAAKIQKNIK
jgi:hypothetical protein